MMTESLVPQTSSTVDCSDEPTTRVPDALTEKRSVTTEEASRLTADVSDRRLSRMSQPSPTLQQERAPDRGRSAVHGSALNSKFSLSAGPNSRRRAHVDATAATSPAVSPRFPAAAFTKASRPDALSLCPVESLLVECPSKPCPRPSLRPPARSLAMN